MINLKSIGLIVLLLAVISFYLAGPEFWSVIISVNSLLGFVLLIFGLYMISK